MFGLGKNKKSTEYTTEPIAKNLVYGERLSFAADEAYKLLRTNLMFSLTDEHNCRIIGVTSSLRGEGKSLTSLNLSYSLAQTGKKVLLLEGDLRLPSLSKTLSIAQAPGLSNLLVDSKAIEKDVTQKYPGSIDFDIITAGDIPPNPSELLGSERMAKLLETLSETYQYIIVDLPPVSAVADPLVVSPVLHGMLVVVRDDYTERSVLNETIRQLQYTNVKLLGFVYNCISDGNESRVGRYYKKYKHYYRKKGYYGGRYGKNEPYRGRHLG